MRFFAQTDEVFDGNETARQAKDDIDRDKASELEPGKGRAVDAKPQCLTNDYVRFGRLFIGKAPMEEINDRQYRARKRNERENKEPPTRPDIGQGLRDEKIQPAPADNNEDEGGNTIRFEGELWFVH